MIMIHKVTDIPTSSPQTITTLKELYEYMTQCFVGRDTEIKVAILALLAREHAIFIGPPGIAKSALINRLSQLCRMSAFRLLMGKTTLIEQLVGVPKIRVLREDDRLEYNIDGMLPTADVAFLDEIYKASNTILNMLLTLIQERIFDNGGQVVKCPLQTLFAAANHVPRDPQYRAFHDRFLFRVFSEALPLELKTMLFDHYIIMRERTDEKLPDIAPKLLEEAQEKVNHVDLTAIKPMYLELLYELAERRIIISDRRMGQILTAMAAHAVFNGRMTATVDDLWVIQYTIPYSEDEFVEVVDVYQTIQQKYNLQNANLRAIRTQIIALANAVAMSPTSEENFARVQELQQLKTEIAEYTHSNDIDPELLRDVQMMVQQTLHEIKEILEENKCVT